MELSAYIAVSRDGFIARANGSMDWLRGGGRRPPDEERRYRVPVLLGSGISRFGHVPRDVWLDHLRSDAYPGGLLQSEYQVRIT